MPTESSAVVRFISSAQQEHHTLQEKAAVLPPPDWTDDLRPLRRSWKVPLLVLGVLLFAAGAAAAGVWVGKHYFSGSDASPPEAATPAPRAGVAPAPAAPAPVAPATPAPAAPATAVAPAPAPAAPALTPEVLAETGFDIRVKPAATISLDGRLLGKAPLRVRNLTPGAHVIDIEAPSGFFSRRVEIELDAGEPQNVNLSLDPIDAAEETKAAKADDEDRSRRDRKRSRRKSRASARRPTRSKARMSKTEVAEALALPEPSGDDKPAAADGIGTLMLGSKPPCDIFIDGAATGLKTPQRAIELEAGVHRITLVNTELQIKKSFKVEISAGKSTRAIHDLTGKI